MKRIGVLLAGSGHLDGAEIRESVLTLLEIDQNNAEAACIAPNRNQHHVVNHLTGEEMQESRNIAIEAARISRGNITFIDEVNVNELDGLLLPGGFGCAKNLCSFAFEGAAASVSEDVLKLVQSFYDANKPIGAICVAPALIALVLKDHKPKITLGPDHEPNQEIEKLGVSSKQHPAKEIVIDIKNKIVSTSAYMNGEETLSDVHTGISKCVKQVIQWA